MARFRSRPHKKGPLPFRYVFLLSLVFFILSTAAGLWIVNKGIEPTLMTVAETETKRIATLVIQNAINKDIKEDVDAEEMFVVDTDEKGNVTTIDFNAKFVRSVLAKTTDKIQANLREASKGNIDALELPEGELLTKDKQGEGIIYSIPLGQATNNALIGNLGPKVPVRFYVVGEVQTDVKETIQQYGINNALIEIAVEIEVNVEVVIPFSTRTATVRNNIPIAIKAVQGQVPSYYNGGGGSSPPALDVPVESSGN
ncbi:sporulation protein YunB [Bacillus sp. FSL H8-0547]